MLRDTFKQRFRKSWGGKHRIYLFSARSSVLYDQRKKKIKGDLKTFLVSRDVTEVGLQVGARASPSFIDMSRGLNCRSAVSACWEAAV